MVLLTVNLASAALKNKYFTLNVNSSPPEKYVFFSDFCISEKVKLIIEKNNKTFGMLYIGLVFLCYLLKTYTNVVVTHYQRIIKFSETKSQNNGYSLVGIPLANVYFHIYILKFGDLFIRYERRYRKT